MSRGRTISRDRGFSLIELVIVVVIIAIIGAIAIPRMSRGAAGAAESALVGDLAVLRNAIDLYAVEHGGEFPGVDPATDAFSATHCVDQLTQYSDGQGNVSETKTANHIYGPYLRKVPPLPVGANKGETAIADANTSALGAAGAGWYYNAETGEVQANSTDTDATGDAYSSY